MTPRKDLSAQALAVWRLLRDEGGYWTAGEVAERLLPDDTPAAGARTAARWLFALRYRKSVVTRSGEHRVAAYGVTLRCTVPEGESMYMAEPEAEAA